MYPTIKAFVDAFSTSTQHDRLLTLSEGYVKVRAMHLALGLGWTLQEGAGNSPLGSVADFVRLEHGEPIWERRPRLLSLKGGSADLAVITPIKAMIEIKARPDYGTKSQAQFQEMRYDVERVSTSDNVAFMFIFDQNIYRSFSGEKTETRGRPSVASEWFVNNFPTLAEVAKSGQLERTRPFGAAEIRMSFWMQRVSATDRRIVAMGVQCPAPSQAQRQVP